MCFIVFLTSIQTFQLHAKNARFVYLFSDSLKIVDTLRPSITCVDTFTTKINGYTGSTTINVDTLIKSVSDGTTSEIDLRNSATIALVKDTIAGIVKAITFTCADFMTYKSIDVKVRVKNPAGNYSTCRTNIVLTDPLNVCHIIGDPIFGGYIATENNQAVANVTVEWKNFNSTVSTKANTDANGSFLVSVLYGGDYKVSASKTTQEDKFAGVTTYDIALLSKHILGIEYLNSPYKIIAADVDDSKDIDASDMLTLRRYILGLSPRLDAGIWRFVDKAYAFKDAKNPFNEAFRDTITATKANYFSANFVAIKVGDLNQSFAAGFGSTVTRSAKTIFLNADDKELVAGKEYTVKIFADDVNAQTLQGTFQFDGAKIIAVKSGDLNNLSDANFGVFDDAVTFSWNADLQNAKSKELKNEEMMVAEITFIAQKTQNMSSLLSFGSSKTLAVATDVNGNEANVVIRYQKSGVRYKDLSVHILPNPVTDNMQIIFENKGVAIIRMLDLLGRVVAIRETKTNDNTFDVSDFVAGCYIVEVALGGERVIQKMIKR